MEAFLIKKYTERFSGSILIGINLMPVMPGISSAAQRALFIARRHRPLV
ncbi:hypothetical protein LFL96_34465 [Paraburkholderia sp. D15]|nr:hypothetical protein [Paraburkholderia sp. D15]WGS53269.1 hypothetical protein LFL96_34465 [Paraburkholderia sp. D15]